MSSPSSSRERCARQSSKSASSTTSQLRGYETRASPTVRLGYAIFTIATLSFLGFGLQLPTPDWGADVATNYGYLSAGYWWETLFPALAIASLVIAINLIGDSIEAVLIQ